MRHQANAGMAAAVYGRLRRQPGVALATLGPGAANLMLPIANAYLDQEPLVAITAQIPRELHTSDGGAAAVEAVRTADPGDIASRARRAAAGGRSLVIAVPVAYDDYRRLF
jgi:glyoxylate carboligase